MKPIIKAVDVQYCTLQCPDLDIQEQFLIHFGMHTVEKNEDILKHVSDNNPDLKIVGFAAETENMIDNARKKLSSKNLNLIVANDVSDTSIGFDSNNNEVTLITEKEELKIPKTSKEKVARKIVQFISKNILND